jgi:hypothetical protein
MPYESFHSFIRTLTQVETSPSRRLKHSIRTTFSENTGPPSTSKWLKMTLFHLPMSIARILSRYQSPRDTKRNTSCGEPSVRLPDLGNANTRDNNFLDRHLGMFPGVNPRGTWLPEGEHSRKKSVQSTCDSRR